MLLQLFLFAQAPGMLHYNDFSGVAKVSMLCHTLSLLFNLILTKMISPVSSQVSFFFFFQLSAEMFMILGSMSSSHQYLVDFSCQLSLSGTQPIRELGAFREDGISSLWFFSQGWA